FLFSTTIKVYDKILRLSRKYYTDIFIFCQEEFFIFLLASALIFIRSARYLIWPCLIWAG
ncbi:MAG: hypothetical protein ABIH40_04555, partial [Candidatus Omnitrophota bacterium]